MKHSLLSLTLLALALLAGTGCNGDRNAADAPPPEPSRSFDRDYTLDATMLGYTGIGGAIDGIRNPVLRANPGDLVRITIINGESLIHDIALEELGIQSDQILEEGASAEIVFTAEASDIYFCTIPGHREAGMEGEFEVVEGAIGEERGEDRIAGVLPEKDGRPLNLDFETGTLEDWSADGELPEEQPVSGDPSPLHGEDMTLDAQGDFFFSSDGTRNHETTSTLTSVPFEVTAPFAAFRVSGGALEDTRVELVRTDTEEVFFTITGNNHPRLRPVVVDLEEHAGREISIRIVDNETGVNPIPYIPNDEWAHINFDDFRFYTNRPEYSDELDPDEIKILPPRDPVANAGLSGEEAVEAMEVPEGFSVTLAASEPDVVRPIAFALDARGRLWVAEANTYPQKAPEGEGRDRILIFEDTEGDGVLDSRKVFFEGLNLVSGIEVGHGGVWVGAAPELLFIPIAEDGDQPAGPPEVLLDGWGLDDTHEVLNSFRWGPDGWLYGLQGVFTHSNVGRPGAPDDRRVPLNAGVWRYHPTRHEFEVYAHGTSNPWGIDFNDYGHPFITVCVIPHLHHAIQGGRFQRQAGQHFNPHTYDDIKAIGDHVHWAGDSGPHAGNYRSGSEGGGHAHSGAMFYLGNEHWKRERNALFMNNIHGYRVNVDHLERRGSGYVGTHGDDFLLTHDAWSQWLNFRYGPDGSVFAIDWYDKNQCHSPNPDVHDKTLGRIFRISHEQDEWVQTDLSEHSSEELVELQLHENDWYVRQARLLLQERGPNEQVHAALKEILAEHPEVPRKLRALWALHVTDGFSEDELLNLLHHESEYVRGWAVQLLAEDKAVSETAAEEFVRMAREDSSALVRLYLASALQRMQPGQRWDILEGLYGRAGDADDANLPLMTWYAAEPLVEENRERALDLALGAELPNILLYTVRRTGAIESDEARQALEAVNERLEETDTPYSADRIRSEIRSITESSE